MAVTTTSTLRISIEDNGVLWIHAGKRAVDDDGSTIGERFLRTMLEPGQDVASFPQRVQRVAQAVWTQAVVDAYTAWKATQQPLP